MSQTAYRIVLWALGLLTFVSVVVAGMIGLQRIQWESSYKQVALAVTAPTWLALQQETLPIPDQTQYVVFDASTVAALMPLNLKPLPHFASTETPFSNDQLFLIEASGKGLVIALPPLPVLDQPRQELLQQAFETLNVSGVIFVDTLLHWSSENINKMLEMTEPLGMWATTLEFSEPQHLANVVKNSDTRWVRSHIISGRERQALGQTEALDRYERAVRERNFRLLVLNMRTAPQTFAQDVEQLASRLQGTGSSLGSVSTIPEWTQPQPWMMWALALSVWTLTIWVFQRLWKRFVWILPALAVLAGLIVVWQFYRGDEGLQFLALSMAIVTPMWLYRVLMTLPEREGAGYALQLFVAGSGATVLGGLVAAAFLSDPIYFLKFESFSGVKLALIEPVLVIAYWEMKRRGRDIWKRLWRRPLTWGDALLGVGIVGGLAVLLLRSGNDSIIPALPFEAAFREQLETWLYARPRFKEFLLGHPALILWLAWGIYRWKDFGIVMALVGFLGQTTMMNSFAHLHTPLDFTLLRVFNGLVLGLLVGMLVWGLLQWGIKRRNTASS